MIDGKEVIDLWMSQPEKTDETPMFNKYTMERFAYLDVKKGRAYELEILMTNTTGRATVGPPAQGGVRLGGHEVLEEDRAIEDAVNLARSVDIPIVMVGLSSDYEYEGTDRKDLQLPGRQDELIQRVVGANPNTVSVINHRSLQKSTWKRH
jgi:beta-glucosidase